MTLPMTTDEISANLGRIPEWTYTGAAIERVFTLHDFATAIRFINAVAAVAEERDHHPDILLFGWNKVKLSLATHSAGGITTRDFALAEELDALKIPAR